MNDLQDRVVTLKTTQGLVSAGDTFPTRVNALIGLSCLSDEPNELTKLEALREMEDGPDIVTDLSIVREFPGKTMWQRIVDETPFVAATVPVYFARSRDGEIDAKELLDLAIMQMEYGVGLITIHLTPNRELVELASKRLIPCTSRGGWLVIRDIVVRQQSAGNAYLEIIDELLSAAKRTGTIVSLGAAFRPGTILDSLDEVQRREIALQTEFAEHTRAIGVGVVIEGPGHCRPTDIRRVAPLLRASRVPIMALGPLPLDSAVGLDHISGAIGATLLGLEGCAHILSGITREEHTGGVPSLQSTLEGVACARVAASIIDLELLNDDKRERRVATLRATLRSCVAGGISSGCSRCAQDCPLAGYMNRSIP